MSPEAFRRHPLVRLGAPLQVLAYWLVWGLIGWVGPLAFRWRPGGSVGATPRRGPFLLLANHTSVLDPVLSTWWTGRRVAYMSLETLFQHPLLGYFLPLVGCFPKAFAHKDPAAMATLAARYAAGEGVVVFPEGGRSWDGRPGVVLPGIGRLLQRLKPRVVVVRLKNAHLVRPRWARTTRWVPLQIEARRLDYDPDRPPEVLAQQVADAIRIDPDVHAPRFSFGWNMAHGLPSYLWACPACFELLALQVDPSDGNVVACSTCEATWRLDTSNRMRGSQPLRVTEAHDLIAAHHAAPWSLEAPGRLLRIHRDVPPEEVADGPAGVGVDGLRVGAWRLPWHDVQVVAVAFNNALTVRTEGVLYAVDLPDGQALMWEHVAKLWLVAREPAAVGGG